jgi:EAL domain-containing protein (putative c-di-GMP-specific phosphodiesterase class I)
MMKWCLEAVADSDKVWQVTIESVPFVIGRADDCNLKLIDNRISRHHSEIHISGELMWIRDLESTNGTFLNQNKIDQAQLIELNDTISIGKHQFKVRATASSTDYTDSDTICETHSEELKGLDLSSLEPKLRELIFKRSVIPHYQPLLRFSDMAKVGYEILGRINDDSMPSNPNELLDIAECLGCGSELSSLFREVGVEVGREIPGSPVMFVNSSKFEIYEMDNLLASMQKIRDIAPSNTVVLEINEKTATDTNELPILRDALEKMNIGLAFDDFGVGQTRLVELSKTPPDYLKFDISLIRKIHLAPKRLHQMVSTFIKASHDLGILTLAEGIECSEESEICQQIGFDFGQGYFFGKPAPINALKTNFLDSPRLNTPIQ